MKIRSAQLFDEYDALNALFNQHFHDGSHTEWAPLIPSGKNEPHILCAEEAGHIIGLALWLHYQRAQPLLYLQTLVVDKSQLRRGVASALLRSLSNTADEMRLPCELRVERTNSGALSLYRKFGFAVCEGELETPCTSIFMERPAPNST